MSDDNGWFEDPKAPPPASSEADAPKQEEVADRNVVRAWIRITAGTRLIIETPQGMWILYNGDDLAP